MKIFLTTVTAAILTAGMAQAGPIDRACNSSDRSVPRALCGCIQQVADMSLSNADQRRAAGFFKDPDSAQKVRMSDRKSDEDFWKRYKAFVATAESLCTR